jgi:hypothetical protein
MKEVDDEHRPLRLQIDPVIAEVDSIVAFIERDLPTHRGLASVSRCVAKVTRDAKEVSRQIKKPIGWHRLPAAFLIVALLLLATWIYWHLFHQSQLRIAVPARDAVMLKSLVQNRVQIIPITTLGSRESLSRLRQGDVDVAFIQGGVVRHHPRAMHCSQDQHSIENFACDD